jgi:hypothetical protein
MQEEHGSVTSTPVKGDVVYSFKPSMMGAPHTFRLGPDAMDWEVGRHSGSIPYGAVRRLRLSFRPASLAPHRFVAEIWSDTAPKLTVASTSWRSLVEQERNDTAYAAFIRELGRRVGGAGRRAALEIGSPPLLYWPGVVICAVLALGLPWILFRAIAAGALGGAALVGALLAVFAWQLGNLFWRNRPGTFRPDDIPWWVLPRR